jgi:hypothetical protein
MREASSDMVTGILYSGWSYRFDDVCFELLQNGATVATFRRGNKYFINTITGKRFASIARMHKFYRGLS